VSWGGLEINSYKLAKWLKEKGHDILMLAPGSSPIFLESKKTGIGTQAIKPFFKYADPFEAWEISRWLKKEKNEALIVATSKDIHLSVLASLLSGKDFKVYYFQHMEIGRDKKDFIHSFFYKKLNGWISPLSWLAQNTRERTKMPSEKIHVIPLCIEVEKFSNLPSSKEEARTFFNLPQGVFLAGIIGRLDPGKGQHILIEALKILKEKGTEVHILLLGDETMNDTRAYLTNLKKSVQEYGLSHLVHFRPFSNETPMAFKALDVFVMASVAETYGMVTIESMASGIPVIGAEAGGTKYLIRKNSTGLFFKNQNAEDLAEKIKRIKTNPSLASGLGNNGRKFAAENYSHHLMCEKIISLLSEKNQHLPKPPALS
jgi:glycosyltransferase involved in cell wall biosynthesis